MCKVHKLHPVTPVVKSLLLKLDIDELGLDATDRRILKSIMTNFVGACG